MYDSDNTLSRSILVCPSVNLVAAFMNPIDPFLYRLFKKQLLFWQLKCVFCCKNKDASCGSSASGKIQANLHFPLTEPDLMNCVTLGEVCFFSHFSEERLEASTWVVFHSLQNDEKPKKLCHLFFVFLCVFFFRFLLSSIWHLMFFHLPSKDPLEVLQH